MHTVNYTCWWRYENSGGKFFGEFHWLLSEFAWELLYYANKLPSAAEKTEHIIHQIYPEKSKLSPDMALIRACRPRLTSNTAAGDDEDLDVSSVAPLAWISKRWVRLATPVSRSIAGTIRLPEQYGKVVSIQRDCSVYDRCWWVIRSDVACKSLINSLNWIDRQDSLQTPEGWRHITWKTHHVFYAFFTAHMRFPPSETWNMFFTSHFHITVMEYM